MNRAVRSLLFFGLAVCSAYLASARVWTIDGKTKVEAEFSGIMGDIVFLTQPNGDNLKVHLASLSAKDQTFIKNGEDATTSVVTSSAPPESSGNSVATDADYSEPQPVDMAPGGSKPVAFRQVVISVDSTAPIGAIYQEPMGNAARTITAPGAIYSTGQYDTIVLDELQKAHYNQLGGGNLLFNNDESAKARYELGAQISGLSLDVYITYPTNYYGRPVSNYPSAMEMKGSLIVDWQVYDTLARKVVYTRTTNTGCSDNYAYNSGDVIAVFSMFRKGFRQLLANSDFASFMKPETAAEVQADKGSSFSSALELTSFRPETALALPADFPAVLDGVVTIKSGAVTGAGFIITEDGYALTAAHVVSGVKTVSVQLHNGLVLDADVVRADDGADVALIKLPGTSHKPLELAADDPAVGVDVYAIGDPSGEELSSSVAKGIVSGKREIEGHKFIQTDASINPGNSGGPLIGKDGRVLGIVSMKYAGVEYQGLGFAVPIAEAIAKLNLKFDSATAK